MMVTWVLRVPMTLKRSWFVMNWVVFGKQAMTQLSVPPMDSIRVFTTVTACTRSENWSPFAGPESISSRFDGGPDLTASIASAAILEVRRASNVMNSVLSEAYGQTTLILPMSPLECVPTFAGK
eukprot:5453396-Heterocapsa_arctica.AAC.1